MILQRSGKDREKWRIPLIIIQKLLKDDGKITEVKGKNNNEKDK